MRTVALVALGILLATPHVMAAPAAEVHVRAGMTLTDALLDLQQRGLKLVFSSQVVRPELTVRADVRSRDLRVVLEQLLAQHGLGAVEERGTFVVVRRAGSRVEPGPAAAPAPPARPVWSEEIVVQPSRISLLLDEPTAPVSLSRAEIEALPHLGDDVFRTLRLLPGTASADLSAELHLRGGRRDEMLVRLDGQELYDPFHLKEYDNALSIVSASALEKADLLTAAFPVSYGDRMGGVLDMTTMAARERHLRLVATIIGVQVEAADTLRDGRTGWFVTLRRGNTDLLGRAFHLEGPGFWDGFAKLETELTPRQTMALRVLASSDRLSFTIPDAKELRTDYANSYVWLTHRVTNGSTLLVDTIGSHARLERDRRGFETDEERRFAVRDERRLSVTSLLQSWSVQAAPRHFVNAGFEIRRFDAGYDYSSDRDFDTPLAAIRAEPRDGLFAASPRLTNEQVSLYASDRMRLFETLTIDAGARFDRHTSTGDSVVSPRLTAAWAFAPSTVLRAGWGRFLQSHRAHELMIEDGDVRVYPAERSNQWIAGIEHHFPASSPLRLSSIRVEAYQRRVANPRPRYENLLGPFDPFPEGEFDRVRIEPERAAAQGLEVLVHGRPSGKVDWFLNYTLASTKDRIEGASVPRAIDQRHAVNADVNRRLGEHWNVNLAWLYRSGHPTTTLSVEEGRDDEGLPVLVPVRGPFNSSRLPSYHRLDLRLSREWRRRSGVLTFFVDAHNVTNRRNVSGVDVKLDQESGALTSEREIWPRFFASAGVSWELNRP